MSESTVPASIAISLTVNGEPVEGQVEPRRLLSDFLRDDVGLTGTHVGCEHGVCGACTILLDGKAVRSCLLFAVQVEGAEVVTVEGLTPDQNGAPETTPEAPAAMHPLQQAFRRHHALQCGFCTPGFLMTLLPFLEENPDPTEAEIRHAISGNLCRCTGYQHIVDAVLGWARERADRGGTEPAD